MTAALVAGFHASIAELANELDRTGFVCLEDVVSKDWLQAAQGSVVSNLAKYGENDFCIINPANEPETPAHRFVSDPAVRSVLRDLASARCPQGVEEQEEIYSVLRVLAGPKRPASSFAFHFDAAVVTMIIPLVRPAAGAGRSGELVVFPNLRPFRRSVLINIAEKTAMQNVLYRRWMARKLRRAPGGDSIVLEPGNVYLFWGYRTYHANMPRAPYTVRATLLLHYGNPHHGSLAITAVKALRRLVAPSSDHTEATVVRF
jgi:hypothetical protein